MSESALPSDAAARKNVPIMRGLLDYFPAACAAVAELSRIGNEQHNPGQDMHWARGKSSDHADSAIRHLMDRGGVDTDTVRHSTKAAWRALANLQEELEREEGAPLPRGARLETIGVSPAALPDPAELERIIKAKPGEIIRVPKREQLRGLAEFAQDIRDVYRKQPFAEVPNENKDPAAEVPNENQTRKETATERTDRRRKRARKLGLTAQVCEIETCSQCQAFD